MNFSKIISYTLRIVNRNRVYSAINLLGLSLGLTVFTLIVLFVRYEFGYDRYQANYDRIYRITRDGLGNYLGTSKFVVTSSPMAGAIKEVVPGAGYVTRIGSEGNVLVKINGVSLLEENYHAVDPEFFKIFSFNVIAGEREGLVSDPTNVVLNESLAIKYFGSAEDAIGKTLSIEAYKPLGDYVVQAVVGDMPFQSHFRAQLILPLEPVIRIKQPRDLEQWDSNNYWTYFTLQPGTDITAAEKRLNDYLAPKLPGYDTPPVCIFQPLSDIHLGERMNFDLAVVGNKDQLYIFLCIGVLVLAIACINYINMATARAANRAKEIGVRKVNGALRLDLVIQFMFEAFVSVIAAAIVAILAVVLLLPAFNEFLGKEISVNFLLEPNIILYGVLLIATVAIIAGAYPAFLFSSFKPIHTLKGRFSQSHNSRLRNVLVVFQFVVSGTLVFSTLIVWKQMEFVKNKDLGFNREHIVIVRMRDKELGKKYEEVREILLKHPSIQKVSASFHLPTGTRSSNGRTLKGKDGEERKMSVYINQVDPNFIDLYEIPVVAGRNLSQADNMKDVLVNETMVRELGLTNEEIVGMEYVSGDSTRIIGVVSDFHYQEFRLKIEPLELQPFRWGSPSQLSIKIQDNDIPSVLEYIKKSLAGVSEKYPFEYTFYDDVYAKTFISEAKTSKLMTIFAGVAIAIAALGLYGLILHMVNQRMKEIGIRKTLGAGSLSIIKLLSGKFGLLILSGYIIACVVGYYGIQRWLEGFAYKISPAVVDFAITLLAIVLIAGLAVSSRIAIALRVNPASVLKQEG
jgi:putative ABC transport system permease protein